MKRWCSRIPVIALCSLALGLLAPACKKESELPPGFGPRGPAVDVQKLEVPALFAHIPADAPYVVASFEAVPLTYYAQVKQMSGPAFARSLDQLRDLAGNDELVRWIDAVTAELDGKLSVKGLESLGLSAKARFALYGHGALPVVARLEIKDGKALLAAVERIAHRAGATLPALETRHGRELWRIELPGELGAIVSISGHELVCALGPRHAIAEVLPQILGAEKPAKNMGDGAELKQLMARHRFGPFLIGFVDAKRLASSLVALAGRAPSPACAAEIEQLTTAVPRLVFSYTELTDKRVSCGAVLELQPPLAAALKELRTSVPGLAAALEGEPLLALGGGFDLARGREAGKAVAATLREVGQACEVEDLVRAARELRDGLAQALPDPIAKLAGGAIAIDAIDLGPDFAARSQGRSGPTIPRAIDGVALLAAADPKDVYEAFAELAPPLRQIGPKLDGQLHEIELTKFGMPFDIRAGVGERVLVVTAGSRGKRRASEALAAAGGGKAPFLAGALDMRKMTELGASLGMSLSPDIDADMAKTLGRMTFSLDATDAGLALWISGEMK